MKGLVIPVLGDPIVVDGDWNTDGVIEHLLDCLSSTVLDVPGTSDPVLSLYSDADTSEKDVNKLATTLVAAVLRVGQFIAGPALGVGYEPTSAIFVELNLLDLVRLAARLIRAERSALH